MFFIQTSVGQCDENKKEFPKKELRGVFVASIFNLDWPTNKNATPVVQQAELISILENLKENGYNTVFFQVRPECDALYDSKYEPWSYRLTGTQGLAPKPFWDPLTFAINEAHKRGLDLHAWLNPYRVRANVESYTSSSNSILKTQPTWILTASNDNNQKILNPGLPAVQDYIKNIVLDIATRYDIDGIHFDDYFYPNAGMSSNQDWRTFMDYNPKNIENIDDWRRNSVNLMIEKVYDAIQVVNLNQRKNIVFGVSPFGIWKTGVPEGVRGDSSFSSLYCDPIAWINAEKIDYLAPQLYWPVSGNQDYANLSKWWNDQLKIKNKQLYASQAYYRLVDANNWSVNEVLNQVNQDRSSSMDATYGQIAYRYTSIKNNDKKINSILKSTLYQFKSFAPPILGKGKDTINPNEPKNIRVERLTIKWDIPEVALDGDLPVKYVVYCFDSPQQAITNNEDGSKILDIVTTNQIVITQELLDSKYIVITSLDKNNNESDNFEHPLNLKKGCFANNAFINIFSNPFGTSFTIYSVGSYLGKHKISLYDLYGKRVFFQTYENSNNSKLEIKITPIKLKKGFYFCKVALSNGTNKTFKILKE